SVSLFKPFCGTTSSAIVRHGGSSKFTFKGANSWRCRGLGGQSKDGLFFFFYVYLMPQGGKVTRPEIFSPSLSRLTTLCLTCSGNPSSKRNGAATTGRGTPLP